MALGSLGKGNGVLLPSVPRIIEYGALLPPGPMYGSCAGGGGGGGVCAGGMRGG